MINLSTIAVVQKKMAHISRQGMVLLPFWSRHGLIGGSMPQGVGFGVSEAQAMPVWHSVAVAF